MRTFSFALLVVVLAGCASPVVQDPTVPIDPSIALVGDTRLQRSFSDFDWYSFSGADKHELMVSSPAIKRGEIIYHAVSPGKRTIFIRIMATAHTGLPGLRDGVISVEAMIEGGKAYLLTGSREGEVIAVWLEEQDSKIRVSEPKQFQPPRNLLIPIPVP